MHRQMGEASSVCAPNNTGFHLQPCLSASGTLFTQASGEAPMRILKRTLCAAFVVAASRFWLAWLVWAGLGLATVVVM
jgi:hypothetical protein